MDHTGPLCLWGPMQQPEDPTAAVRPRTGTVHDPEEGLGRAGPPVHHQGQPDPRVHRGDVLGRRVREADAGAVHGGQSSLLPWHR